MKILKNQKFKFLFGFLLVFFGLITAHCSVLADVSPDPNVTNTPVSVVLEKNISGEPIESPENSIGNKLSAPENSVVKDKLMKDGQGNADYYGTLPQTGLKQEELLIKIGIFLLVLLIFILIAKFTINQFKKNKEEE